MKASTRGRGKMGTVIVDKSEFAQLQAAIGWYASIVTWLLNRAENTPLALKELVREASHERLMKFGPERKKDDQAKD